MSLGLKIFRVAAPKTPKKRNVQGCLDDFEAPSTIKSQSSISTSSKKINKILSDNQDFNLRSLIPEHQNSPRNEKQTDIEIGTNKKEIEAELFGNDVDQERDEDEKVSFRQKLQPPKKPPTAYLIFREERRLEIQEKNVNLTWSELTKQIALDYKQLDGEGKKKYEEQAVYLKEVWNQQLKEYCDLTGRGIRKSRNESHDALPQREKVMNSFKI